MERKDQNGVSATKPHFLLAGVRRS